MHFSIVTPLMQIFSSPHWKILSNTTQFCVVFSVYWVRISAFSYCYIGRIIRLPSGSAAVTLNDHGVQFTTAHFPSPLPEYSHILCPKMELSKFLTPVPFKDMVGTDEPLVRIKLTQFKDGGSILGVSFVFTFRFSLFRFFAFSLFTFHSSFGFFLLQDCLWRWRYL